MLSFLIATAIITSTSGLNCDLENVQFQRYVSSNGVSADVPKGVSVEVLADGFYVPSQCGPEGVWLSAMVHDDHEYSKLTTESSLLSFMVDRISAPGVGGQPITEYLGGELLTKNELICVRSEFRAATKDDTFWVGEHYACLEEIGSSRLYVFQYRAPEAQEKLSELVSTIGQHFIRSLEVREE